jgi:hypothetical protein
MGRVFQTLEEAGREIARDLAKGTKLEFTRVQQHMGTSLPGRERQSYEYCIMDGGIPHDAEQLVALGRELGIQVYTTYPHEMERWLITELKSRLFPYQHLGELATELDNPLLQSTIEGNFPSYTYRERMYGAAPALLSALENSLDTRRAFWPIFLPQDSLRASQPTRIPCSLGYEVMLRNVDGETKLQVFYLERSCDFDRFWLSDVWFAYRFGEFLASQLGYEVGAVYHYVISLHSFESDMKEIY